MNLMVRKKDKELVLGLLKFSAIPLLLMNEVIQKKFEHYF